MYTDGPSPGHVHPSAWVESVPTDYRASLGSCVCSGVHVRSGSSPLLILPLDAPDSPVAPPTWSPLPAMPSWHALPPPCFWSSQVSTSPPALTCPALPSLHRGAAARRSSLLISPDDFSPADSPHGRTHYTTVFPLHSKGEVPDVLIPWIRVVRLHLCERFREDLPVVRLHSDRGGEFSSDLLQEFCRGKGILQSFTLPASLQQNGVAERRIGLVMEVARTSMIHAAAPHFLWPFAVRYAAHQLNLWPRLSSCAIPCVFLGFPPDWPSWQFYHPTSRRVSPLRTSRPPSVDPLPPQGPAPSGVSQVDPLLGTVPVEVGVDSGAPRGDASGGAEPASAELGGGEPASAELGGAQPEGAEPVGAESEGAESRGAEPGGSEPGGAESEGAESRVLSLGVLRLL
ncbi:unnamed protein product [Closterium sp. NIES-53]